ncbi:hypothetical protein ACTXMM_00055 [Psychrobacter maritimus]
MNVSILLDELKQDGKCYILVSEALELISRATSSPVSDVKTFLLANNIYYFMPVFFQDEFFKYEIDQSEDSYVNSSGEFWSTYAALTSELSGDEYFSIEQLNEFEPIYKYDIFAYKRGYHYIAKKLINNFNRGEYVIGLPDEIINNLLKNGSIEKVPIEQPNPVTSIKTEFSEIESDDYLAMKAKNDKLNIRIDKAVNIYKDQKGEIAKLKEQLEKCATDKQLLQDKIEKLENQLKKVNDELVSTPADINKKEGQGDSLLILGAVMHCIQDAAKKNYTQELLTQVILERYKSVSGISEGTLKKKFPEAKKHINQRLTSQ